MKKHFKELLSAFAVIEVPKQLNKAIFERVAQEQKALAKRRLVFVAVIGALSLVAIVPAFRFLADQLTQSGFARYVSMAFSDSDVLLASWQQFAILLAGSLPLLGITAFLTAVIALLGSLRSAVKNAPIAFARPHSEFA